MSRLPVTVVAGFAGAGKSTLIGHWLRSAPPGQRWAVLANASAMEPADAATLAPASHRSAPGGAGRLRPDARPLRPGAAGGFYRVVGGCACCTAQASARAALVELLRAGRWDRLVVELDGAAHPAALIDLLRSPPFDAHLQVDGVVSVVDAARPAPFENEPMHPLARAQVEVADRIVLNRAADLPRPRCEALVRRLAGAPPFGRSVVPTRTGKVRWGLTVDEAPTGWTIDWRAPAEQVYDRARLQRAVSAWPGQLPLLRGTAGIRTERDWYLWRYDGGGSTWEAGAYRLENRVSLSLDPGRLVSAGADAPEVGNRILETVRAELAGTRIAPDGDQAHGSDEPGGV